MAEYKATLAILAAIVSHAMMGAGPALTRYLQTNAVRPISALSLLALGNLIVLALYTPRILYKIGRNLYQIRQQLIQIKLRQFNEALEQKIAASEGLAETLGARTELQENVEERDRSTISKTVFKQSAMTWETIKVALLETKQFVFTLPILLITVLYLVRTITQTMATNYARANQVQLVDMFTPFFIAIFTSVLLQNNQYMNLTSAISLLLTAAGGILIVFGMEREDTPGFHWRINWELVAKGVTWSHLFGIALAAIALVAGSWQLALKHHTSFKFTQEAIANSQHQEVIVIEKDPRTAILSVAPESVDKMKLQVVSSENSFIVQNLAMVLLLVPLSLLFSDWTVWKEISYVEWTVFIVYSLMVFMFSNMLQSYSIKYVGSSRYSLLYSIRLVSTITLSWILLNEQMNNILQFVGAGIVILSSLAYTIYLIREETRAKLLQDTNVVLESKNVAAAPIPPVEEIQLSKLHTEIEIQQQQAQDVKIAVVEVQPPALERKTEVTIEEVKPTTSSSSS